MNRDLAKRDSFLNGCAGFFDDASFGGRFINVVLCFPPHLKGLGHAVSFHGICRTVHNLDMSLLLLIGNEKHRLSMCLDVWPMLSIPLTSSLSDGTGVVLLCEDHCFRGVILFLHEAFCPKHL